jgi:hypothetical protein
MVGAVAHSGRAIFAAGAVMVAAFFTFSLSGPLPPTEMGVILGAAVLLDAVLVRLVLLPVLLRLTRPGRLGLPDLAAPAQSSGDSIPMTSLTRRCPKNRSAASGVTWRDWER